MHEYVVRIRRVQECFIPVQCDFEDEAYRYAWEQYHDGNVKFEDAKGYGSEPEAKIVKGE